MDRESESSLDDIHQKTAVPGPCTVASSQLSWPGDTIPLRAASTPSNADADWPNQGLAPPLVHVCSGASNASASGMAGMTVSTRLEMVLAPNALLAVTE